MAFITFYVILINILLIIGGGGSVTAIGVPYYMKFWQHVNLAILKNPYLVPF